MLNIFRLGRVYIRLGNGFILPSTFNFDDLLKLYAEAKQFGKEQKPLIEDGKMCRARTIACLVDETNKFIKKLGVVAADEDMASFTSQRQVRLLGRALSDKRKSISGYSMIILHCIHAQVHDSSVLDNGQLKICTLLIRNLVETYYEEYPDDDIARFLLRCYPAVLEELDDPSQSKQIEDFPSIPKSNANDSTE